ncbi:hypothetical protein SDC9_59501 [bioreactor metagenome]|uniref:Uncharacterized protein n=1 Tax=bioreactor metagenome TaxID=1076179 RepID=A0A644XAA1_9ZZZZ
MVYNAIDATMVEYEYKLTTVNGTLTTVAVVKDTTGTIISKKFALDTAYGTLDGFTYDSTAKKWTYSISVASGTLSGAVRSTSDFTELYGRSVRVLSKATSSGTTIYGIFADDSNVLATGILGDVTLTSGVTNSFKFGGTTYKMDSGALATTKVWAFNADQSVASPICTLASITTAVKPYAVSLIDDDNDGLVDFAVAVPFTVEKVTYVGSTTFTTSTGSVTKADVSVYDGIAKNDFVIVVNSAYTATQKTTYTKATVISGEATSTKDSGATFQIGGTWYKLADSSALISGSLTTAVAGSKYEKVAVVNGYAFNLVGSTATAVSDYAVVTAAAGAYGLVGDQAKLLFTDGTTKVVDTAADYTTLVDKLVTYTIDSDGDYVLTAATADVSAATAGFDTVVAAPAGSGSAITASYTYASGGDSKIGSSYIASDAVIFIKGTSWKVINGAALAKTGTSAITGVANAYANTSSSTGFSSVALAVVTGTTTSGDVSHGYVTATPAIVKVDNKLVYQVTFWDGTKNVTANTTQLASSLSTLAKNSVITFTYDDQDINVSNVTALTSGTSGIGAVTGLSDKQIQFAYGVATEDIDNDSTLEDVISTASKTAVCSITDDTVIIYIDRENSAGVAGSALQLATGTAGSNKLANVYYELNGTDVTLLIVDVQNDILNVQ